MSRPADQRIIGLDGWRAGLMLFGIVFHAIPENADEPFFLVVGYLSSHFRMGAFMAISGLLTGMSLSRRAVADWLPTRTMALAIPLMTGVLITVPAMAMLRVHLAAAAISPASLALHWYHLWFLVALMLYLPISAALGAGARRSSVARDLLFGRRLDSSIRLRFVVVATASGFALLLLGGAARDLAPVSGPSLLNFVPLILGYFPLYFAATLLGSDAALRTAVLSGYRLPLMLIPGVIAVDLLSKSGAFSALAGVEPVIDGLSHILLPVLGSMLVLRSALDVAAVPRWLHRASQASLTIYLLHFPIVKLLHTALDPLMLPRYAQYLVVVAIAAALSWAIYAFVVSRSPVASWLFTGRRPAVASEPVRPTASIATVQSDAPDGASAPQRLFDPRARLGGDALAAQAGWIEGR